MVAAALAVGLGDSAERVLRDLQRLKGAPGRLEKVAHAASGAPIYVDYAHTPHALETVLTALRPHVQSSLRLVFGCGGDRDKVKRPAMGAIAARLADAVIVTDDNPRSEDPSVIRAAILASCPNAHEIGDRAEAIRAGIAALQTGDVLVIAGKGHESGQLVGTETRPFLDSEEAIAAAIAMGGSPANEESA
jgi:UDP-N-acetylmuramoyl-L-alanyl-D-glutamate--2,6-diaminopimelate ligase